MLQLDLNHFLGIVPGATGVGHEDGLVETEDGDRHQVADKVIRLHESKSQRGEEHGQKDIEHAFLRVLGADLHYLLAVFNGGFRHAIQLDVFLDELHRAISTRGHGLNGSAGKPVDDCAAGDQAEHKRSMQE